MKHRRSSRQQSATDIDYREIFEVSNDAMFIHDPDTGAILDTNLCMSKMLGYSRAEARRMSVADFSSGKPPHDQRHAMQLIRRALRGETPTFAWVARHKSGRLIPIQVTLQGVHVGGARRVLAVAKDQSQLQEAERALQESRERERCLAQLVELASQPIGAGLADGSIMLVNQAFCDLVGYTEEELRTISWSNDLTPPEWRDTEAREMRALVRTRRPRRYEKEYIAKDGRRIPIELVTHVVRDERGKPRFFYAFLQDITDRKRAEALQRRSQEDLERLVASRTLELAESNAALRRANRTLDALRQCNELMVRAKDERDFLEKMCRVVASTRGDRVVWLGCRENDAKKSVHVVAAAGISRNAVGKFRITWSADSPRGLGPSGIALRSRRACIWGNARSKPGSRPWRSSMRALGIRSVAAFPIDLDPTRKGVIVLYSRHIDAFKGEERILLQKLAQEIAVGVSLIRNRNEKERLQREIIEASEREKRRIGFELHDGLCQTLVASMFRCGSIAGKIAKTMPREAESIDAVYKLLGDAVNQTRDLSRNLAPVDLDVESLRDALEELVTRVRQTFQIGCSLLIRGKARLSDSTSALHLYRIAQEAVGNAIKHGRAKQITLRMRFGQGKGVLSVEDNGRGMSAKAHNPHGMGLRTMRHRAELIEGNLDIRARIGGGTIVRCEFPYVRR